MRLSVLIAMLLTVAAPMAAAQSVQIELRTEATVTGVYYALGEIARVRTNDPVLTQQLRAQRIGRAPRVGQSHGVSRAEVAARLARAYPKLRGHIRWAGPGLARVEGAGQKLLVEDYVPIARAALDAWLAARFPDYELEPLVTRTPVTLPLGQLAVQPRLPEGALARNRMSVWLDFSVDGQHYRTLPLWFAVTASRPGFVANKDLRAGRLPTSAAVRAAVLPANGQCAGLADEAMLTGRLRLRSAVAEGAPLCAENLEPPPAVTRGEELLVTAQVGPVVVKAVATALEDGQPGQTISVRRGPRGTRFAVEVTGTNEAQVKGEGYE